MKTVKLSLVTMCFLALTILASAQEKFSRIKIYPPADAKIRSELLGLLEIDHFHPQADGAILSEISETAIRQLKKTGYKYEILVDDVAKEFETQSREFFERAKREGVPEETVLPNLMSFEKSCQTVANIIPTPSLFSTNGLPPGGMGGFYTYAEMVTKIDEVVALYPTLAQKINLGSTIQGRTIWAVKISDNVTVDENEPEVLYTALQHAREAITGTSMIFFMQYLVQNYGTNTEVQQLVNNREFYIVPCVNPDGYEYNRSTNPSGGGTWRKNRRLNSGGSYGVDLNRNYGVDWANCAGASASCGSGTQSSDTYWGTSAFSEPESQAIRNLVISRNFVAAIDQHCFGPYYSLPFGRPSLHTMNALDAKFYTYVPALMGKYNGMRAGNSPETVNYEVAGGIKDWLLLGEIGVGTKGKIYGMTGEGGGGGFWAPSSQIISLCKGMTFQNLQLALAAGPYYEIVDMSNMAVSSLSGSFNFSLRRVGLQNAPVTVSLERVENVMYAGAPVTINSMPNYFDSVNRSINYDLYPGLTAGQRIRFVWRVQSEGITTFDTITKIYNPVTVFSDNMESGSVTTNWTVTSGFGYSTANAFQGSRSLSESPTGNYTTSSTRLATLNTPIDLNGATAAYISFWVRHRSENFRDILRMQVSTNGGSTWNSVCGKNTVQENSDDGSRLANLPALTGIREEWFQEIVDLGAYLGNNNLRFRFEFSSDGDATSYAYELDQGFSIDNFQVVKTNAILLNRLPIKFVNVKGRLIGNSSIQVEWEAITDDQHDYFEVEKSLDGNNFTTIARVKQLPPYIALDKSPAIGNNYYRIRNVNKDGSGEYSRIINVVNNPRIKLTVYPNPVSDVLRIKIDDNKSSALNVTIMDMQGRMVYNKILNEVPNSGIISVNTGNWISQVYQLKITNNRGELVTIQKFIKQ